MVDGIIVERAYGETGSQRERFRTQALSFITTPSHPGFLKSHFNPF
jgi:hypothetical protein